MKSWASFGLCGALLLLLTAAAPAGGIPLDDAGFTVYVQQKLQLYSPAPVRVTAPFALAIGPQVGANLVFEFKPLHDACVADPAQCSEKTHEYIQDVVRHFPSANAGPAPSDLLPQDKPGFMTYLAGELSSLLAGDRIEIEGLTLSVTRPGGHAIALDQSIYYTLCAESGFNCKVAMRQALTRSAAWLAVADPARLRSTLRVRAKCATAAPTKADASCTVTASPQPLSPISRPAFANLDEVCFKPVGGDAVEPLIDADRRDLGLAAGAALDLCDKRTHAALPPLPPTVSPPPQDGIVAIVGPYAASRALFAADWKGLAAGGHFLIAVPARDMLLYVAGDSLADIAALRASARQEFAGRPFAIGADVYRWTGQGWELVSATTTNGN